MQTVAVTCCVLLMILTVGGVWGMSLDDEDLFDRDADTAVTNGKGLKKLVTAANNGIDNIIKSTTDEKLKADLTQAKAGLAKDLELTGNVARSLEELAADDEDDKELERRGIRTNYNIGRGWSVGLGRGLQYQSRNNRFTFRVQPSFRGFKPNGFRTTFKWRF